MFTPISLQQLSSEKMVHVGVGTLELSRHVEDVLRTAGVFSIAALTKLTARDLQKLPGVGDVELDEILLKAKRHSIKLRSNNLSEDVLNGQILQSDFGTIRLDQLGCNKFLCDQMRELDVWTLADALEFDFDLYPMMLGVHDLLMFLKQLRTMLIKSSFALPQEASA